MQVDLATAQAESKLSSQNLSQEKLNSLTVQNQLKMKEHELSALHNEIAQLRANS